MSFLDEVQSTIPTGPKCGVAKWLLTQGDVSDEVLREAAARFTAAATHRAMVARGFTLSRNAVERHVAGRCSCPS